MKRRRTKRERLLDILALLIIAGAALLLVSVSMHKGAAEAVLWQEYVIMPGDTLWSIARREYGDTVDIREVIAEICAENDIAPDKLMPGTVIMVPMAED